MAGAVAVGATVVPMRATRQTLAGRMHRFVVMAIDRESGDVVWERVAREAVPHEGHQEPNGTYASGSAVTDGDHLFAFFGSWGLYAYDMDGNLQWEIDLGTRFMRNAFGEGTTPALHGDTLVVAWDHIGGQSFIVALDKRTGEERWRANRDEIDTWATPLIRWTACTATTSRPERSSGRAGARR